LTLGDLLAYSSTMIGMKEEPITPNESKENVSFPDPETPASPGEQINEIPRNRAPVEAVMMDLRQQGWLSLKWQSFATCLAMIITWLAFLIWNWQVGVALLMFLIPIAILGRWWSLNQTQCTLHDVISSFGYGFTLMALMACVMQWISILMLLLIIGWLVKSEFAFMIFCIFLVYVCYTAPEEWLKVFFAKKQHVERQLSGNNMPTKRNLIMTTSTSLGYATAQGFIWMAITTCVLNGQRESSFGWICWFAVVIALWGTPIHCATGYLIGLEIMRETPTRPIITKTTLIRGTYIYQLVLIMALGPIGVLLLLITIFTIYFALWRHIKELESTLPLDYIQRMGQLSVLGYGVLGDGNSGDELENRQIVR